MILMSSVTLEKKCIVYETWFGIILPSLRSFNKGLQVVNFHYSNDWGHCFTLLLMVAWW